MELASSFAELVAAVGSILIPVVLLYWAPKISTQMQRADQRQSRAQLFEEMSACLNDQRQAISNFRQRFDCKAYGKELDANATDEVRKNSTRITNELELTLVAFTDTLSEVGRDKLGDVIKAKQASMAACELQNRMKKESDTWLKDANRKVTGPVAYKHFGAILELIDLFDAQLIE